jgi:ferredoxin
MADRRNRVPDNLPGNFYVDHECIDCDLCRELAPENFERNEDEGYSYVYKQPETDPERDACKEALESCPVEAIGEDGAGAGEETGAAESGTG